MPSRGEVVAAVYGAWRLMCFDADGMRWFNVSMAGFWRSFFAAVVVAPGYAVLVGLNLSIRTEPFDPGWAIMVSGAAYAVGWVAFPVAAIFITRLLGLTQRYFPLIVAYNWASVPQMLVYLPAILIDTGVFVPAGSGPLLSVAALVFILAYQWFVTRTALDTTGLTALGVVLCEVLISEFVHLGADRLI